MKRIFFVLALMAAGTALRAQSLGGEYRLKRIVPVEGRQGIAADSNYYYVSGSTALYKYDKQGRLVAENEHPFEGLPLEANHLGDIDVWNGELYAGIETFEDGKGENIQVAVYDADNLKWKRSIDWDPESGQVEVSGLAVDRDNDMVWMSDWVDGRYLYGYDLKTGKYVRKVHLRPVPQWQQGIFMVDGRMLISADDGDADLDEPDTIYIADMRDGKSYATALPFRAMTRFPACGRNRRIGDRSADRRIAGAGQPRFADRVGDGQGLLSRLRQGTARGLCFRKGKIEKVPEGTFSIWSGHGAAGCICWMCLPAHLPAHLPGVFAGCICRMCLSGLERKSVRDDCRNRLPWHLRGRTMGRAELRGPRWSEACCLAVSGA